MISYERPDEKSYLMQYVGPDKNFNTADDYYFYPTPKMEVRKLSLENLGPDFEWESRSKEYKIDYYSGYILSQIEQFWMVFGHYPDTINKINNIFTNSIFTDYILKKDIIYQYFGPQRYLLQLPGYDEIINTDDYYIEPHYGEGPALYEQRPKSETNQG